MGRVLWAALWVAAVVSMPIKEPVTMLDESYTDAETEHGLPELDDSLSKSMEAASLTKKAHEALEKAGSASAIAHSILEAVTVAKAKFALVGNNMVTLKEFEKQEKAKVE